MRGFFNLKIPDKRLIINIVEKYTLLFKVNEKKSRVKLLS